MSFGFNDEYFLPDGHYKPSNFSLALKIFPDLKADRLVMFNFFEYLITSPLICSLKQTFQTFFRSFTNTFFSD